MNFLFNAELLRALLDLRDSKRLWNAPYTTYPVLCAHGLVLCACAFE